MATATRSKRKKRAVHTLRMDDVRYIQTRALDDNPMLHKHQQQELGDDDAEAANALPARGAHDYKLLNMITKEPFGGTSSYHCWWDSHPFKTAKVGIVVAYDARRQTYYMFGNFCSWPCAISYSETRYKLKHNCKERRVWMRQIYRKAPWKLEGRVRPAPDPVMLTCNGGIMTIEQFRAYGYERSTKTIHLVMPTDELQYNLVGLAPAFQIQERTERDLRSERHTEYKAMLDKHIPEEKADADGDVTMVDAPAPAPATKTTRPKRKGVRARAAPPPKKPKYTTPTAAPTHHKSTLLRFLNAAQERK